MKIKQIVLLILIAGVSLTACRPQQPTVESPVQAIDQARAIFGFSDSTLTEVGETNMSNSPQGDLPVLAFQDEEGRSYFVEPDNNTLVEMDGRALIGSIWMSEPGEALSQDELAQRAGEIAGALVPGFEKLKRDLNYEAGNKGEYYFFDWRATPDGISFMPPFIQVAMTADGTVFAFYNTASIAP